MQSLLRLKAALVRSPLEGPARNVRQWLSRVRPNLELAEILLEEERLSPLLNRILTRTSNVLDVGCHIGSFLSLATKFAPEGGHAAIEASPGKADMLRKKFPKVRIEQVAVSDSNGTALFREDLDRPGFSRLAAADPVSQRVLSYEVRTATIDSLDIGDFDLVKLDIEGAELAALRGGTALFRRCRPHLIFECGAAANEGLDRAALFQYLTTVMNYNVFTFADFLYGKGPVNADEFRKCGLYPFRAFNFLATPIG